MERPSTIWANTGLVSILNSKPSFRLVPTMPDTTLSDALLDINTLIAIVRQGGTVITGVDIFNNAGNLLLAKNAPVKTVSTLLRIKQNRVRSITISPSAAGGLWDRYGKPLPLEQFKTTEPQPEETAIYSSPILTSTDIRQRLEQITELKQIAKKKYEKAKNNIKIVIATLKKSGGEINVDLIEETVTDLFNFVTDNRTAFSYLTKDIFSYDDYLYNHSINVCTIGTVVLQLFNEQFSMAMNRSFSGMQFSYLDKHEGKNQQSFKCYFPDELRNISIGYFMHDLGKVLIPDDLLNKQGRLTAEEFNTVKGHSISKGLELLAKNRIYDQTIRSITRYHHAKLFQEENRCYPEEINPEDIPPYVRICKLADIYDAMTSKRSYKEAMNPVGVVAEIFHQYAEKDYLLQFILHSFVKSVGIFPPGSIVYLQNGQLAYIIDSLGPVILPISDKDGKPIPGDPVPINLADDHAAGPDMNIDRRRPLASPSETFVLLPAYLKKQIKFW